MKKIYLLAVIICAFGLFSFANATTICNVFNGCTGVGSFGQGWIYSPGGTSNLAASTSPTVNYITATSTTATSTFANGINITKGCFANNGTCITGGGGGVTGSGSSGRVSYWNGASSLTSSSQLNYSDGLGYPILTFGNALEQDASIRSSNTATFYFQSAGDINLIAAASGIASGNITLTPSSSGKVVTTYASTTALSATTLCLEGDTCRTTWPTGTGQWTTSGSNIYYTTGNVGIGTTTPNWPLQVAGTRPGFVLSDTSAGANSKHWGLFSEGGNLYFATSSDALATTTTSTLSLNANGRFYAGSIGTAALPIYSFAGDTDTGLYSSSANVVGIAVGGANGFAIKTTGVQVPITGSAVTPALQIGEINVGLFETAFSGGIGFSTAGAERGRFEADGKFGLGTSTPGFLFDMFSTGTTTARIDSNSASKGSCLIMKDSDGSGYTYITANNGSLTASTIACN